MDWVEELDDEGRAEWERFVRNVREHTVKGIASSAFVMSFSPSGKPDIKIAVELGLALWMDKPLVLLIPKGHTVSSRVLRAADEVIHLQEDIDTEAGSQELIDKIKPIAARLQIDFND